MQTTGQRARETLWLRYYGSGWYPNKAKWRLGWRAGAGGSAIEAVACAESDDVEVRECAADLASWCFNPAASIIRKSCN